MANKATFKPAMNKSKSDQKLCSECARDNEIESAYSWCVNFNEALCTTCDRRHRRNKASSNHKLVEIDKVLPIEVCLQHADVLCSDHSGKKVEAYCYDHSAICCVTCVMLKHRKCEKVSSIEDAAERKKQSKEVVEFEGKLKGCKKSLEVLVQGRTRNLQSFVADIYMIRTEVDKLFDELFDHFNQLKINILSEISMVEKEVRPEIEDERIEMKCRIPALESDLVIFQTTMKHSPPAHFLQLMEKLSEKMSILENYVKDKSQTLNEIRLSFSANEKLLEMSKVIQRCGRVNITRAVKDDAVRSADTNAYILPTTLTSNVYTGFRGRGIALLKSGNVLVSRYGINILELRDTHCSRVLSSLSLPGYPWGIKMTSDTNGAVTLVEKGLILFNIQNNQISKITEIKTNVNYDFVYHQGKYYVGCYKKIAVYNKYHREIHDISVNNDVSYMAVRDNTSLCYTEFRGHKLYCIHLDGTPLFTYSHNNLLFTTGVTVDHAGHIYVCGFVSNSVHQLSHDGKLQRIIFGNLPARPYCISFSTRDDKAVIGCNRKILLYDLQ